MHKMEDRISGLVAHHCRKLALICILSAALPAYLLRNVHIDNAAEIWLSPRNPALQDYQNFLAKYGNEEFVVIAGSAEDPLSTDCLAFQKGLADRLRRVENVENVFTLARPAELLAAFRPDWADLIRRNALFRNLLLGEDGHTFGLVVYLKKIEGSITRKAAIEGIEAVVADVTPDGARLHLAGSPLMNVALDRGSMRSSKKFLPAAIIVSVVILAITLHGLVPVLAVLCAVGIATLWAVAVPVVIGKSLNIITVAMPSLLFVLSLSGGIHITSRFLAHIDNQVNPAQAIRQALREVIRPVFLSNVTTALGFSALSVSEMPPVVEFGLFTGIGIMISFVFNMTVVPGILCLLHRGAGVKALKAPHWTAAIGRFVCRHYKRGVILASFAFALSIVMALRARIELNVLEFFPADSAIREDYEFVGEKLTGLYTTEIDVTTIPDDGSTMLKTIDALSRRIATRPEVAKTLHYGAVATCFKEISIPTLMRSRATRDNPMKPMLRQYMYQQDDRISLRLSVFIRRMANSEFRLLQEYLDNEVRENIDPSATYKITGIASLSKAAEDALIDTQIRSLALAGVLILMVIGGFMRSARAALAAVLPNLLPIFSVFAVMSLIDIPFDTATVMIASVAIGIAADDTVHFLAHYKEEKQCGLNTLDAVDHSLQKAGPAITYTSVVTAAGFVVLLLADFKPIRYFGLFTSITMIAAWIGDVFILPACVTFLRLWDRPKTGGIDELSPSKRNAVLDGE
jgi:predicted RND superfamily exporter protein